MFRRIWREWFSNPRKPLPVAAPTFENAAHDELTIVYVSAFHHERIAKMMDIPRDTMGVGPDRYSLGSRSFPELLPIAKIWLDENTPGYTYKPSHAANFLIDITFINQIDAVKFKLFWL